MAEVSPRLKALLIGQDPMIRYLVRESLATQGVHAEAEANAAHEMPAGARHDPASDVVVLCLSGPPSVWSKTIAETRRSLPGGRIVAVTFGHTENPPGSPSIDQRLGADTLVHAPAAPEELRDAVFRARLVRSAARSR